MEKINIMSKILTTLFLKISRRTNEKNAIYILKKVINDLKKNYPYLSLIIIDDAHYKENTSYIRINNDNLFNRLSSQSFDNCIKEMFELTIKYLRRDADYFFIREFKEAVNKIEGFSLNDKELDLNQLQFNYLVNRKQDLKIKNSKIFEAMLQSFFKTINKLLDSQEPYAFFDNILKSSYKKFDFLKSIQFERENNKQNSYILSINPSIDYIPTYKISKSIIYLIEQIGNKIKNKNKDIYIETLKNETSNENLLVLKKIGVNLNLINLSLSMVEFENILNKILSSLFSILLEEKSKDIILINMKEIISDLKQNHGFLDYIMINDKALDDNQVFDVKSEINDVPANKFAKALREIIINSSNFYSKDKSIFIDKFKSNIGEKYLYEIERIGVNLHFLEMKFLLSK